MAPQFWNSMQYVTVVNRTSKPLEAVWDGLRYAIPVGESAFPEAIAKAAKRQNIVMGSEDPRTLRVKSLIGVKEWGDDVSKVEQTMKVERWDRESLPNLRPTEVVPGDNGIYSARDVASDLPAESNFVKP